MLETKYIDVSGTGLGVLCIEVITILFNKNCQVGKMTDDALQAITRTTAVPSRQIEALVCGIKRF